jgi:GDP-L-fucose synthase
MKNVLIVGGFGFIGKNLAQKLQQEQSCSLFQASRRNGLDLFHLDHTKKYLRSVKPDIIFNCAAHTGSLHYVTTFSGDVIKDNIQLNLNLYEAVKEECPTAEIINPLSNCSYPGDANIQSEMEWLNGPVHHSVTAYANSKRTIYFLSDCYKNQYGIKTKNFLVPNAFGPGNYLDPNKVHALDGLIIRLIQAKRRNDPAFEIWGSGNPVREWGFVKDIVSILLMSPELDVDLTYPVNIAQNKGFTIKESAETIAELIGYAGRIVFNTQYQDGAKFKILDDRKFRSLFPDFQFTDHREAIQQTIKYYEEML